jgi:hypothetical protein
MAHTWYGERLNLSRTFSRSEAIALS